MTELYQELGLTEDEYRDIIRILGREPNKVELGMYPGGGADFYTETFAFSKEWGG